RKVRLRLTVKRLNQQAVTYRVMIGSFQAAACLTTREQKSATMDYHVLRRATDLRRIASKCF
ncbi:MAG: hypothetical protein WCK15_24955, partial [Pirellula sp.]